MKKLGEEKIPLCTEEEEKEL